MMDLRTDIDIDRLAQGPMAEAEADCGTWFEAPTAFGPMWLRLPTPAPARHAAAAAVVLQHAEELIAGLDTWTAHPLPWRWRPSPAPVCPPGMRAFVQGRHADWEWFVPWAWLRARPAPHDLLNSLLHWPAVPAVLSLARLQLSDEERQQLEPGGAVLLPPSLQPAWHGWLRSAAEPPIGGCGSPAGVAVALPSPWTPRPVRGDAGPEHLDGVGPEGDHGNDGGTPVEVRLDAPGPLPGDQLTGWPDAERSGLDFEGAQAGLWRYECPAERAHRMACGRLIPWGDGWALVLDSVDPAPETAAAQTV
jgi:hypothetical protein